MSIHNIIKLAATIFNNKKCEQKCQKRNKHHQLKEKIMFTTKYLKKKEEEEVRTSGQKSR